MGILLQITGLVRFKVQKRRGENSNVKKLYR